MTWNGTKDCKCLENDCTKRKAEKRDRYSSQQKRYFKSEKEVQLLGSNSRRLNKNRECSLNLLAAKGLSSSKVIVLDYNKES